jgi:competence protein ComEC
MTFLHADGTQHSSFNENSLVVRLDLGRTRVLIMGDAEAGGRLDPATPPVGHSIEGTLLQCCSESVRADVMIVGHHGSKTSSRANFLNAVGASIFVVSAGPMKYGSVVLRSEIIAELEQRGRVSTDLNDATCGQSAARSGRMPTTSRGCDNVRISIPAGGPPVAATFGVRTKRQFQSRTWRCWDSSSYRRQGDRGVTGFADGAQPA